VSKNAGRAELCPRAGVGKELVNDARDMGSKEINEILILQGDKPC
jgi:hypothetical protein